MNLFEVAKEIADRLTRIFLRDERGRRPVYGGDREIPVRPPLARPPPVLRVFSWRQRRRAGASHQTGWTGLVGTVIHLFGMLDPQRALEVGKMAAFARGEAKS